ncbi:MAG: ATP synthase F1 subunit gamma [Candidatus Paceibacterota bacterium]|jgi:F-type H+-transporting ATPase subunit gamma
MQTKVIKEKIKSVGSIKKITKTMEMVSAAKMKKAIENAHTLRPFHEEAQNVLKDISLDPIIRHELLLHNGVSSEVLIIVASNKGLCGSYNVNIYRKLLEAYDENERKNLKVVAFGKYSEKVAKKLHAETLASFNHPVLTSEDAHATATMIVNWYKEKKIGTVRILYTHFTSGSVFTPTILQLLPFSSDGEPSTHGEPKYAYEPDQETVLSRIIPMMIHNIIYGAVLESYASEHSARMFAMKSATDNAKELQDDLKLYFNRARQGQVTQEIAEITSGTIAMSS